ncbi:putative G-protein coupled receptor 139 [Mustelus asterias]
MCKGLCGKCKRKKALQDAGHDNVHLKEDSRWASYNNAGLCGKRKRKKALQGVGHDNGRLKEDSRWASYNYAGRIIFSLFTVNLIAILILLRGKCGLSACTALYLMAMAVGDLMVIITEVILRRFRYYYYPTCFLDLTPACTVINVLLRAAIDWSVWFTVMFSFDRFVAISCQKLKTKYCTKKTAAVVLATTAILLSLKNIPWYFRFKPRKIIDNVPWFCSNTKSYTTDPRWVWFTWFALVLTPLMPFAFILFLNALTVKHILVASRARKLLKVQRKGQENSDPEMVSRRKSMVLLFTISGSFILLWLLYVFYLLDVADSLLDGNAFDIFEQVAYMLRNLNCCTNTFIYLATQSVFRAQFKRILKYPVTQIIQLLN